MRYIKKENEKLKSKIKEKVKVILEKFWFFNLETQRKRYERMCESV